MSNKITLISTTIFNVGLSNIRFSIDGTIYQYNADKHYVRTCEKIARFSDNKALNYIRKRCDTYEIEETVRA